MKYSNYFFMLYTLCMLYMHIICDDEQRIQQFKALVKKEGWSMQEHILQVRESGNYHDVHSLFAPNSIEITSLNIDEKLRHVQKFLSCDYAVLLTEYCEYVKTLGHECKKKENPIELFNCLEQYHQKFKDSNPLIVRMIGAFSYFDNISPNTRFNRQVPEILYYLKRYYDTKEINKSEFIDNNGNIKPFKILVRIQDFEDMLTNVVTFSQMFLKSNCSLKSNYDKLIDGLLSTSPVESVTIIIETIDKCIDHFVKLHNEDFGFQFDTISETTDVDEAAHNEIVAEHIVKFNKLLSNAGWCMPYLHILDNCGIIDSGYNYTLIDLFETYPKQKLVYYGNYDTIIRQAHQALSCNFAHSLKDYVEYAYGLSFQCEKLVDDYDLMQWQGLFTKTIKYGKKMLLPMKFAFMYFNQLSEFIAFNTNISVVVDYMLCYFDQVKFNYPSFYFNFSNAIIEMVGYELEYSKIVMSFIERYLRLFLREFCWPIPYRERTEGVSIAARTVQIHTIPSDYPDLKDRLNNMLKEIIIVTDNFKKGYEKLGFEYNLSSSNDFDYL